MLVSDIGHDPVLKTRDSCFPVDRDSLGGPPGLHRGGLVPSPCPSLSLPAPLQSKLSELEVLALLIAALSHDLDHRGVNNSYIQR